MYPSTRRTPNGLCNIFFWVAVGAHPQQYCHRTRVVCPGNGKRTSRLDAIEVCIRDIDRRRGPKQDEEIQERDIET
jgi:hypothetical protein